MKNPASGRSAKEHEGQLHIVLDGDRIENIGKDSFTYFDGKGGIYPVGLDVLKDTGSAYYGITTTPLKIMRQAYGDLIRHRLMSTGIPEEHSDLFVDRFFRGEIARVFYIDSRGGDSSFAADTINGNLVHKFLGANVTGFLKRKVMSAALLISNSMETRFTTKRTEFLWHYCRSILRSSNPVHYAALLEKERFLGSFESEKFERFLEENVDLPLVESVIARFRKAKTPNDQHFEFSGSDAVEWKIAKLLSGAAKPKETLEHWTGIDLTILHPDHQIRKFMDDLEEYVEHQELIRPLF